MRSRTITVSIACPPARVYAFASNPENVPRWVAFCHSVRRSGADWIMETANGAMTIRFVPPNDLGVLDHYVIVAPGREILNPMRVVPNGEGSEFMFTLFQQPGMSDDDFAADAALVARDLETLKRLLDGS